MEHVAIREPKLRALDLVFVWSVAETPEDETRRVANLAHRFGSLRQRRRANRHVLAELDSRGPQSQDVWPIRLLVLTLPKHTHA